jgi:CBS domain-containing protein
VDDTGVVVGVVSKTDLTRARAQGDDLVDLFYQGGGFLADEYSPYPDEDDMDLGGLAVADVMNRNVYSVNAEDAVSKIASEMIDKRVHRFLVTDGTRFVGIVSSTDLLRVLAAE